MTQRSQRVVRPGMGRVVRGHVLTQMWEARARRGEQPLERNRLADALKQAGEAHRRQLVVWAAHRLLVCKPCEGQLACSHSEGANALPQHRVVLLDAHSLKQVRKRGVMCTCRLVELAQIFQGQEAEVQ